MTLRGAGLLPLFRSVLAPADFAGAGVASLRLESVGVLRRVLMPCGAVGLASLNVSAVLYAVHAVLGRSAVRQVLYSQVELDSVEVSHFHTLGPRAKERQRHQYVNPHGSPTLRRLELDSGVSLIVDGVPENARFFAPVGGHLSGITDGVSGETWNGVN